MSPLGMKPTGDRILVREIQLKQTKGGIVIPETATDARAKNVAVRCEVVAFGPGQLHTSQYGTPYRVTCEQILGVERLEPGMVLMCSRYLGDYEFQHADGSREKLKIVNATDVIGLE
jgi:co-chaperonin GroES (HSP10)